MDNDEEMKMGLYKIKTTVEITSFVQEETCRYGKNLVEEHLKKVLAIAEDSINNNCKDITDCEINLIESESDIIKYSDEDNKDFIASKAEEN